MAVVKPFKCTRPDEGVAAQVAALPYDVYSRKEAKAAVQGKPLSFLNIDRPETQYDDDFDMYSGKAYETARDLLKQKIREGVFISDPDDAYYLYELTMNGRKQTGIVACCSIDDYVNGVIKKHENTLAAKEQDRINHIRTVGAQTGPIFLAYRKNDTLSDIIGKVKLQKPLYDFTSEDGISHRVWKVGSEYTDTIRKTFEGIDAVYIADGHHRAASAVKVGLERREQMNDAPCQAVPDPESDYFMSVLFADEELAILPYNRAVRDLNGLSEKQFMEKIREVFDLEESRAFYKNHIAMYIGGAWYYLVLKPEYRSDDSVDGLDVSRLQTLILDPVLGIKDPKTDSRISFVGGIRGDKELERLVDECGYAAAFSMYPTQMSELLAVADDGRLMPPKSTWFEPKLRSGLFIHKI
ncbi:MAG: DUF1015 domain-containing protein [Lachnospiraceae bacterium]|nr:DUF1015 domain-containing protein [Candidatus Darwinimomas equi]